MPSILIVEDDIVSVRIIQSIIKKIGYNNIGIASTAEECLSLLEHKKPALVLMDINLTGELDGIYASEVIHKLYDIPVVFITGAEEKSLLDKAKKTEPYGFLIKPITAGNLASTIEIALYKHEVSKKLKESERFLTSILGNTPGMVYQCKNKKNFDYIYVSNGCLELTGYEKPYFIKKPGSSPLKLVLKEDKNKLERALQEAYENTSKYELVYRIRTASNGIKWLLDKGQCFLKENGEKIIEGLVTDITNQKNIEEMLKLEHDKLEVVTNSAGVGLALINRYCIVEWANDVLQKMYPGIKNSICFEHIGQSKKICRNCKITDIFSKKAEISVHEIKIKDKRGKDAWVELVLTPLKNKRNQVVQVLEVVIPITEKKKMEESIRESKQIRALAAHLETIREEEKINIAREIHDELGQSLTALKFDVAWLNKKMVFFEESIPETVKEKFTSMSTLIDSTMRTIRKISSDLRPVILDDLGLLASLEWQISEFQLRTNIECIPKISVTNLAFSKPKITAFYRVFQEILTNIARHSQATKVKISVKEFPKYFYLNVTDNGVGLDKKQLKSPKSLGLLGIKERTILLGGEVTFESKKNTGTSVTLRVPKEDLLSE